MATTPSVGTPPHRTEEWAKAATTGATTPLLDARPPPKPDHPFETPNPFATLGTTNNDLMDDGSGHSDAILLTPTDGDVVASSAAAAVATLASQTVLAARTDGVADAALGTTGVFTARSDDAPLVATAVPSHH